MASVPAVIFGNSSSPSVACGVTVQKSRCAPACAQSARWTRELAVRLCCMHHTRGGMGA